MSRTRSALAATFALALAVPAGAQQLSNAAFVNGITINGGLQDLSAGTAFDRRLGFFSDIYYDRNLNEWWGLSDRGPGGGTLPYETRLQRFTLNVNGTTGAISGFNVVQTIKFNNGAGQPMNGLAPNPSGTLGNSFDPEGIVINPINGHILVSDEYGPSLVEFDRAGNLVRRFTVPPNLVPKVGANVDYSAGPPTLTSGREGNRGFEGLAISPDGKYAYAVLQNGTIQDGWTSQSRAVYSRIVKFDVATGQAVGQYAYKMQTNGSGQVGQGGGISALVALGNDKFLVLERNNRGIGVGATLASPDKNVFQVDLNGATDVTNINLPAWNQVASGFTPVSKSGKVIDLDQNTLAALGNKSPEKWEGLAVGPQLSNGKYLVLAGTDNDYSVTQNGTGTQFDVWYRFTDADPYQSSLQCALGDTSSCFRQNGTSGVWDVAATWDNSYELLPGVLHAYTADITGYVTPVPEPATVTLMAFGLAGIALVGRRRRSR